VADGRGATEIIELELPNGAVVLAHVRLVDGAAAKVGRAGRLRFDDVADAVEGVATAINSAVAKAAPDKVSVTLGFELAVKSGALTALLVAGDAKASLALTLEWERDSATASGDA
jgi:hypothetical protein